MQSSELIEQIIYSQANLIKKLPKFHRDIYTQINWEFPVIAILGSRGVGKTTIMLQQLQKEKKGVYFSCDHIHIQEYGLFRLIHDLHKEYDQRFFYIDEIHRYNNWAKELKNATDSFSDARFVISGSSRINILKESYDLSRRLLLYKLHTLTFREFLEFKYNLKIPAFELNEIFSNHAKISFDIAPRIKQKYFHEYTTGYSYFYRANVKSNQEYAALLENAIKKTVYEDIASSANINSKNLIFFEKILFLLGNITPSEMSFARIGQKLQIDPKTVEFYCGMLEETGLIFIIKKYGHITNVIVKDKKIILSNTNLLNYFSNLFRPETNEGMMREIFFVESIKRTEAKIWLHGKQDYVIEHFGKKYICEIGGKSKPTKNHHAYFILDDLHVGIENKIPLWIFGLVK